MIIKTNEMTRQEFCKLLTDARDSAKVPLNDALAYAAMLSFKKIDTIETGKTNFALSDALLYLRMTHSTFEWNGYDMTYVDTLDEIRNCIKKERKYREWSIVELAKHSHISSTIIYAFEDGRCDLKIDTFLKLINACDITIEID